MCRISSQSEAETAYQAAVIVLNARDLPVEWGPIRGWNCMNWVGFSSLRLQKQLLSEEWWGGVAKTVGTVFWHFYREASGLIVYGVVKALELWDFTWDHFLGALLAFFLLITFIAIGGERITIVEKNLDHAQLCRYEGRAGFEGVKVAMSAPIQSRLVLTRLHRSNQRPIKYFMSSNRPMPITNTHQQKN